MSNSVKKIALVALGGTALVLVASVAGAVTTPLSVSCSGTATANVIAWSATVSGGTVPYAYLWSGTNVAGTSSVATATYNATGTYQANIQVSDSASSTATSSCTATITTLPASATTTPPVVPPFFKEPMLNINPGGHFLARGMAVTSVASTSFTGQVWGITYTVDVSGIPPQFFLREREGGAFSIGQLKVGDEVGVSGQIDVSNPFFVDANVVRDYSLIRLRPAEVESENDHGNRGNNGQGNSENEHGNGLFMMGNAQINIVQSSTVQFNSEAAREQLKNMFERVREMQKQMQEKHGGEGD